MKHYIIIMFSLTFLSGVFGQTTITNIYSYDDLNRLIQVDFSNGKIHQYTYDELGNRIAITVRREDNTTSIDPEVLKYPISIYPNPTSDNLILDLPDNENWQSAEIRLLTSDGRLIEYQGILLSYDTVEIDVVTFPKGVYILQLAIEEKIWSKIFIKK